MTNLDLSFPHFAQDLKSAQSLADHLRATLPLESATVRNDRIIPVPSPGTEVTCDENIHTVLRHRLQGRTIFCPASTADNGNLEGTTFIHYDTDRDFDPNDLDPERYLHMSRNTTVRSIADDEHAKTEVVGIFSARSNPRQAFQDGLCLIGRRRESTGVNSQIMTSWLANNKTAKAIKVARPATELELNKPLDLSEILKPHRWPRATYTQPQTARAHSVESDEGLTAYKLLEASLNKPTPSEQSNSASKIVSIQ